MLDKRHLKSKLKRLTIEIEKLMEKSRKQHLGGQEHANLRQLILDQAKVARQMKRERNNGKTKTE